MKYKEYKNPIVSDEKIYLRDNKDSLSNRIIYAETGNLVNDADGSGITFDKTAPTFTAVTIASDNSIDDAAAKVVVAWGLVGLAQLLYEYV